MKRDNERQPFNMAELERRVLDAARNEQPSAELSARMASGIGLSAIDLSRASLDDASAPQTAPFRQEAALTTGKGGASWSSWVGWVTGAVVTGTVVGAVVATNTMSATKAPTDVPTTMPRELTQAPQRAEVTPVSSAVVPHEASALSTPSVRGEVPPSSTESQKVVSPSSHRSLAAGVRSASESTDIRAEIALVDAARKASQSGAYERTLGLLNDYDSRHANGSFRPEVTALRIEALAKSGRRAEASRLAQRFLAAHRGSPLAERVEKYQ